MTLLKATKIEFYYDDQADNLFDELCFDVNMNSKVGLIGRNGCGKTTLFSLLKLEQKPLSGNLYIKPDIWIGHLSQEVQISEQLLVEDFLWQLKPRLSELKTKMEQPDNYSQLEMVKIISEFDLLDGYSFDVYFQKVMSQFHLDESFLNRKISTLSGGEKTKIALARIMLTEPDLLLLDEPTNHLDIQTLHWLEDYLRKISIPYILISHDRKFLDNCVEEIWEIDNGKITTFSGNYSFYKLQKEDEFKRKMHQYESAKKRIKKLKKAVVNRKNWAKSHQPQTGKEGYAPVYETVVNPAKDSMRRAKAVEGRLTKEIEKAEEEKPWIEKKREIHFEDVSLRVHNILSVIDLSKSFDKNKIIDRMNFSIENGSRVSISGQNGSGKTTLLKILMGDITEFSGDFSWSPQVKIGYHSQELEDLESENSILKELINGDLNRQEYVRTILGSLNLRRDKVHQKIGDLSIGEKSKVSLTRVLSSDANVLVLDEPTNHLEIVAREALEQALLNFYGTILFVSHDRYFCDKLKTEEITMDR